MAIEQNDETSGLRSTSQSSLKALKKARNRYNSIDAGEMTGVQKNFKMYTQDMEERDKQLKATMDYTIDQADQDFKY